MTPAPPARPRRRRRGGPPGGRRKTSSTPAPLPQVDIATDIPWELGDDVPPVTFASLGLDTRLMAGCHDMGYQETRPVQTTVIPLALQNLDVVACAETGTGKTLGFVVPILQRLLIEQPPYHDPLREPYTRALILAPTRELASQIEDTIVGLTYHTPCSSAPVYGGVEMWPQERALKAGVDIVVATPGRLMDHMRHDSCDFTRVQTLVLDEADRMLDMGFWPDVRKILGALPKDRQTLLFSATMPNEVVTLAREMQRSARYVQIGRRQGAARTITHAMEEVETRDKVERLARFIKDEADGPVLVFVRTKIGADKVARNLQAKGVRAAALHADRTQQDRQRAVEGFRSGAHPVLVATDIAARGLDIDGIAVVVNFEVPDTKESYVHRVGRTGRAGSSGRALTLVAPDQRREWKAMETALGLTLA
ncbi:MAG: DEAD/DEAH box helicase [Vicinamibacterales bacterium]